MKPLNPADYPTYNVGDEVTIRQWDDMESEFGLNKFGSIDVPESFTKEMKRLFEQSKPTSVPPSSLSFDSLLQGGDLF